MASFGLWLVRVGEERDSLLYMLAAEMEPVMLSNRKEEASGMCVAMRA